MASIWLLFSVETMDGRVMAAKCGGGRKNEKGRGQNPAAGTETRRS